MIVKKCSDICSGKVYLSTIERMDLGPDSEVAIMGRNDQLVFLSKQEWEELRAAIERRNSNPRIFAAIFLQKIDKRGRVQIPVSLRGERTEAENKITRRFDVLQRRVQRQNASLKNLLEMLVISPEEERAVLLRELDVLTKRVIRLNSDLEDFIRETQGKEEIIDAG